MSYDYSTALRVATDAAREAGALLLGEFHRPGGPRGPRGKCPADNEAEAILRRRLDAAFPNFGTLGEELGHQDRPPRDPGKHTWLIDPNDGTTAFQSGERGSSVSIGLLRDGLPVLAVVFAFAAPDDGGDLIAWAEGCGPVTRNGQPVNRPAWPVGLTAGHTVLVSGGAESNPLANARVVAPARFRAVPSIAYRLALIAVGEAEACASVGAAGAVGWDYGAGHALLRGAGGELFDRCGDPVRYAAAGQSGCGGWCCGGGPGYARELALRDWSTVLQRGPKPAARYGLARAEAGLIFREDRDGVLARAQGCLLGQFAGDALGGLVEFGSAASIANRFPGGVRTLFDGGHWRTLGGQPTDDSEMALMLARSIVAAGKFDPASVAEAYAHWYDSGPFDVGGTTSTALSAVSDAVAERRDPIDASRRAASQSSQANGALMRVSPLGVFGFEAPPDQLAAWARADAAITHPHPACQDASALFAVTLAFAIRTDAGPKRAYEFACEWARSATVEPSVLDALTAAADGPPADFQSQMGWVLTALRNAFFRLLHAPSLEAGVVDTVMAGGDTDTNAAIAGALLGAAHGRRGVPRQWQDRVLTCHPMRDVPEVQRPRPADFWPVDALILAERLLVLGRN